MVTKLIPDYLNNNDAIPIYMDLILRLLALVLFFILLKVHKTPVKVRVITTTKLDLLK